MASGLYFNSRQEWREAQRVNKRGKPEINVIQWEPGVLGVERVYPNGDVEAEMVERKDACSTKDR